MRIAFLGTRGVPARYSGFETFVEELGSRLVERGHDVTVYCRRHHALERLPSHAGMRLLYVPGIPTKHLDTISHTALSAVHAALERYDVTLICISGNSPLALFPRLAGSRVIVNVDGSDWRRLKWGRLARLYLRGSERLAPRVAHAVVTDSEAMRRFYLDRFGKDSECIGYGASVPPPVRSEMLNRLGLRPRGYFLLVHRLVPENRIDHLVGAYESMETDLKCVVVGDAPYAGRYIAELRRRGPHVLFPGYVFGDGYRELMHNAYAVVVPSEVGGAHPVLLEAMAAGNCVVVNNTPANLEVIGDAGLAYDGQAGSDALRPVLERLIANPPLVEEFRGRAATRAASEFSWERVTDRYEELFKRLMTGRVLATAEAD